MANRFLSDRACGAAEGGVGPSRSLLSPTRRAVIAGGLALLVPIGARAQGPLVVFAAASLKPALDEIAAGREGGAALSYASSGTLARQVAAGAPADVVILAAADWMDWLDGQGLLEGEAVSVASNRLVLAGPPDAAPVALETGAILARLGEGRLAIGDPMSVPAGRYAQQALEALGLWPALAPRLLAAQDARAALAYVESGDAPLGIVYGSDTAGTAVSMVAEIPPQSHVAITYPAAVTRGAAPGARAFLERVAASGEVFAAHGFAR